MPQVQPNYFDQFDERPAVAQPVALNQPSQAANFFDQFDEPAEPAREPIQTPERAALQAELNKRTAAADRAGTNLKIAEFLGEDLARPVLRATTDLADGALSLPLLAASAPVAGYNALTGSKVPLPIGASVADSADAINRVFGARSDSRSILAPKNNSEQLATTITKGVGGVLGGVGIGGALGATGGLGSGIANTGRVLAANPGLQTAGAVTGGISSDLARRGGFGAIGQSIAGLIGGSLPGVALQGANKLVTGLSRTPEAQRLIDAGVDLTPGQMNPKGFANQLEETVQSAPLVGPVVRGARDNARSTFQRAAANAGAAPGTVIRQGDPAQMLDDAYQSFQPLYDKAKGFPVRPEIVNTTGPNVRIDAALSRAVANRGVRATAEERALVQGFLDDQLTKPLQSSDDLLNIRSAVRAESRAANASGQSAQSELLDDADNAITQALDSQLPPDALRALRTADSKYGDYKTLEKAVYSGSTKPEGFTPFDLAKSVKQSNRGENLGGYARGGGGPLRELADDAVKSMEVRAPATGQRLAALPVATVAAPVILGLAGSQSGRRLAQGITAPQRLVQNSSLYRSQALQRELADPYAEQLALALQQAIELQKRRQAEGKR